jgi:hypothetical protein
MATRARVYESALTDAVPTQSPFSYFAQSLPLTRITVEQSEVSAFLPGALLSLHAIEQPPGATHQGALAFYVHVQPRAGGSTLRILLVNVTYTAPNKVITSFGVAFGNSRISAYMAPFMAQFIVDLNTYLQGS